MDLLKFAQMILVLMIRKLNKMIPLEITKHFVAAPVEILKELGFCVNTSSPS